jgi:hypothetical protein
VPFGPSSAGVGAGAGAGAGAVAAQRGSQIHRTRHSLRWVTWVSVRLWDAQ